MHPMRITDEKENIEASTKGRVLQPCLSTPVKKVIKDRRYETKSRVLRSILTIPVEIGRRYQTKGKCWICCPSLTSSVDKEYMYMAITGRI